MTGAVRGAGVYLAGSISRSGGGVRGASRSFLKIGAFTRGDNPPGESAFRLSMKVNRRGSGREKGST